MRSCLSIAVLAVMSVAILMASPLASAQRVSLADRVAALEQRAANDKGGTELVNQISQLRSEVQDLRGQVEVLQQQLEHNLVILGTAHAVAEGIVRGVSSAVDKRRTPPTYGANGRSATPRRSGPSPMALSRIL